MSFLNNKSNDYISLSKDGLSILGLDSKNQMKYLTDNHGTRYLVHSLASCNYLKIDTQNHILFECSNQDRILNV